MIRWSKSENRVVTPHCSECSSNGDYCCVDQGVVLDPISSVVESNKSTSVVDKIRSIRDKL